MCVGQPLSTKAKEVPSATVPQSSVVTVDPKLAQMELDDSDEEEVVTLAATKAGGGRAAAEEQKGSPKKRKKKTKK